MSLSSKGKKVTRVLVYGDYHGYDIVKVVEVRYEWSPYLERYHTDIVRERKTYFEFCKMGESNSPSQAYRCHADSLEECKECIDKFIEDDTLYFTKAEIKKYVTTPNEKCQWAYGYVSLKKLMQQHKKADKRMKKLIEERLEDANFKDEYVLLCDEDYEGYEKHIAESYQFREKFEILTTTKRKCIEDPKRFEVGLARVIEEYLVCQGVKDTTTKVTFIEKW